VTDGTRDGSIQDEWAWVSGDDNWAPPSIDTSKPSVARMYDYFLGGKDHLAVDREAAEQFIQGFPDVPTAARANRAFLARSVLAMTEAGIEHFLDLGTGIPTVPNVHENAWAHQPGARIVYVDNDPVVLAHNRALLSGEARVVVSAHDLRDADAVLGDPRV